MRLLAIDPGRGKCGLVAAEGRTVVARAIVDRQALPATLAEWSRRHRIERVVLGDRTGAAEVRRVLAEVLPGLPVAVVSEAHTTLLARRRYFADHPPRGLRRLLPVSLQLPPGPYDDYAAAAILERYLVEEDDHKTTTSIL